MKKHSHTHIPSMYELNKGRKKEAARKQSSSRRINEVISLSHKFRLHRAIVCPPSRSTQRTTGAADLSLSLSI